MSWHGQVIFESKGDKLSFSAECRVRIQGLWNRISCRLHAHCHTDWAIENQAKNLNSIAHPYDQRAFSPLDPTAGWLSHLALAIYMFVVNSNALVQASDCQIKRRQDVFLCWMQDSNPESVEANLQHTECLLTNWAIEDQAKNTCISIISGVCEQHLWNAQLKGQLGETHGLKVKKH